MSFFFGALFSRTAGYKSKSAQSTFYFFYRNTTVVPVLNDALRNEVYAGGVTDRGRILNLNIRRK